MAIPMINEEDLVMSFKKKIKDGESGVDFYKTKDGIVKNTHSYKLTEGDICDNWTGSNFPLFVDGIPDHILGYIKVTNENNNR